MSNLKQTVSVDSWECPQCGHNNTPRDHGESGESATLECSGCGKKSVVTTSIEYTATAVE